jgi:hypothetical protein
MRAEAYFSNFVSVWQQRRDKQNPLLKTILKAHFWRYHFTMFLLKIVIVGSTFLKPLLLNWMLRSLAADPNAAFTYWPYVYSLAIAVAATFQAILVHFYFWQGVQNALAMRGALICLVQQKVLRMHSSIKSRYSSGVIINLCSVDADNIMSFCWNSIHEIWASPVMVVVSLAWLVYLLGTSALAGCGVMFLSVAFSAGMLIGDSDTSH